MTTYNVNAFVLLYLKPVQLYHFCDMRWLAWETWGYDTSACSIMRTWVDINTQRNWCTKQWRSPTWLFRSALPSILCFHHQGHSARCCSTHEADQQMSEQRSARRSILHHVMPVQSPNADWTLWGRHHISAAWFLLLWILVCWGGSSFKALC